MSFLTPDVDNSVITAMRLFSSGFLRFAVFNFSSMTEIVLEHPSPVHIAFLNVITKFNPNNKPKTTDKSDFFSLIPIDVLRRLVSYWTVRELGVLALSSWNWYTTISQNKDLWEGICLSPFIQFGLKNTDWKTLTSFFPQKAARFALYYPTDEERKEKPEGSGPTDHKFIFVYWCPAAENIKQRLVYTGSKGHLKLYIKRHVKGSIAPLELDTLDDSEEHLKGSIHAWYGLFDSYE